MEDVGRVPTELAPQPALEPTTIPTLDGWIESLMTCKQLAEVDVQRLCEKVCNGKTALLLLVPCNRRPLFLGAAAAQLAAARYGQDCC